MSRNNSRCPFQIGDEISLDEAVDVHILEIQGVHSIAAMQMLEHNRFTVLSVDDECNVYLGINGTIYVLPYILFDYYVPSQKTIITRVGLTIAAIIVLAILVTFLNLHP